MDHCGGSGNQWSALLYCLLLQNRRCFDSFIIPDQPSYGSKNLTVQKFAQRVLSLGTLNKNGSLSIESGNLTSQTNNFPHSLLKVRNSIVIRAAGIVRTIVASIFTD